MKYDLENIKNNNQHMLNLSSKICCYRFRYNEFNLKIYEYSINGSMILIFRY